MYTIDTYSREYPDQVPGYYQWYKTYSDITSIEIVYGGNILAYQDQRAEPFMIEPNMTDLVITEHYGRRKEISILANRSWQQELIEFVRNEGLVQYMEYQKVLNVMANMPKLWPTIKVSAHAIEGQYDQWCVDIFSEGVNKYGVKVIMRYDAIADANEFEKLLHYVNKISHGFLPPDKAGA